MCFTHSSGNSFVSNKCDTEAESVLRLSTSRGLKVSEEGHEVTGSQVENSHFWCWQTNLVCGVPEFLYYLNMTTKSSNARLNFQNMELTFCFWISQLSLSCSHRTGVTFRIWSYFFSRLIHLWQSQCYRLYLLIYWECNASLYLILIVIIIWPT